VGVSKKRVEQALRRAADLKRKADKLKEKLKAEDDTMSLGEFVALMAHSRLLTSTQTRVIFASSQTVYAAAVSTAEEENTASFATHAKAAALNMPATTTTTTVPRQHNSNRSGGGGVGVYNEDDEEEDDAMGHPEYLELMQASFVTESTLGARPGGVSGGVSGGGNLARGLSGDLFNLHAKEEAKDSDELNQLDFPEFLEALLRVSFVKSQSADAADDTAQDDGDGKKQSQSSSHSQLEKLRRVCQTVCAMDGKPKSAAFIAANEKKEQAIRFYAHHGKSATKSKIMAAARLSKMAAKTEANNRRPSSMQIKKEVYF